MSNIAGWCVTSGALLWMDGVDRDACKVCAVGLPTFRLLTVSLDVVCQSVHMQVSFLQRRFCRKYNHTAILRYAGIRTKLRTFSCADQPFLLLLQLTNLDLTATGARMHPYRCRRHVASCQA